MPSAETAVELHRTGPLQEWFASNEFYYNPKTGLFAEDRLIPTGLTFAVGSHARFRIYYVLDSVHTGTTWVNLHVLQTQLLVSFR